jgi:hypothetical protein
MAWRLINHQNFTLLTLLLLLLLLLLLRCQRRNCATSFQIYLFQKHVVNSLQVLSCISDTCITLRRHTGGVKFKLLVLCTSTLKQRLADVLNPRTNNVELKIITELPLIAIPVHFIPLGFRLLEPTYASVVISSPLAVETTIYYSLIRVYGCYDKVISMSKL